jgi:hypothetical protein
MLSVKAIVLLPDELVKLGRPRRRGASFAFLRICGSTFSQMILLGDFFNICCIARNNELSALATSSRQ